MLVVAVQSRPRPGQRKTLGCGTVEKESARSSVKAPTRLAEVTGKVCAYFLLSC
jgi:hypothetical protein